MIYVCEIGENHLITHDGHIQLGSLHCTLEWYLDNVKVPVTVVYWKPDPFCIRYDRLNYQRTMEIAGKDALENSLKDVQSPVQRMLQKSSC